MPPRLQSGRIPSPACCQCLLSRTARTSRTVDVRQPRLLHVSPQHAQRHTKLRREMIAWLNGPGKKLRDPLPGSTNYLGAYDRMGNLQRLRSTGASTPQKELTADEVQRIEREEDEQGLDDEQRELNALTRAGLRTAEDDGEPSLPKENPNDLRPYPLNRAFQSQPVLSEELRESVYRYVAEQGRRVEDVAAAFRIDMRRVAAVVRLKTIEKKWLGEGKQLAKAYSEGVMAMLPQTPLTSNPVTFHESVNDLPVHPRTRPQLFWPTSESRHFTREDAAKAFDDTLLPADKRIPLPALVKAEKLALSGLPRQERIAILRADNERSMARDAAVLERQKAKERETQKVVAGRRWDFKFEDINAEKVGKHGRSRTAVGIRYGMPHEDRKRGMVKIPTSVE